MKAAFGWAGRDVEVEVIRMEGGRFRLVLGDRTIEVDAEVVDPHTLRLVSAEGARTVHVARREDEVQVSVDGRIYGLRPHTTTPAGAAATLASPQIVAPMPGKVLEVLVEEGQRFASGDGLIILEAMKMENRMTAEASGTVVKVHVAAEQMVDGGQVLLELEYDDG